jgi:hypothetical protein
MKLLIFGSRTLEGDEVQKVIKEYTAHNKPLMILTSGETAGVCAEARKYAKEQSLPLLLFWANPKYHKGKYAQRSIQAINECDKILFIHDGTSKGTSNEIKDAQKLFKPYTVKMLKDNQVEDWFINFDSEV